jgi:hypothetical protein
MHCAQQAQPRPRDGAVVVSMSSVLSLCLLSGFSIQQTATVVGLPPATDRCPHYLVSRLQRMSV